MTFGYGPSHYGYDAFFSYGTASIKTTSPFREYNRMTEQQRHRWRQEKYAEAERKFGIKRGGAR